MKFNKIAACVMATACAASMFGAVASVSAANDFSIAASSETVKKGEDFTIDISLAGVPSTGVAGLDFSIKYDSSVFKVNSISEGSISKTGDKMIEGMSSNLATNAADGAVSVIWATGSIKSSDTWIKKDGVLLTLNCTATGSGSSKVEIAAPTRSGAKTIDAAVADLKVVNPSATAGSVTISDGSSSQGGVTKIGDVNLDGSSDLTDLTLLSVYLMTKVGLSDSALANADIDGSGTVDISDLAYMKQYVSKDSAVNKYFK